MATRIGGSAILKVIHVGLWLGNRFLDVENPGTIQRADTVANVDPTGVATLYQALRVSGLTLSEFHLPLQ